MELELPITNKIPIVKSSNLNQNKKMFDLIKELSKLPNKK